MIDYVLFIESNTTGSGMQAMVKARELDYCPVLFSRKPEIYEGLGATGCLVEVCETNDIGILKEKIEKFTQTHPGKITGITTTSEFYIESVAALAESFNIPSNPLHMVRNCRNKGYTREILTQAGLPQPRFALINSISQLADAIEKIGLPCVIKPSDDTGSFGVKLCSSLEEAEIQASALLLVNRLNVRGQQAINQILCEEYVEGPEYSVETIAKDGDIYCIGITEKRLTGFPFFVEAGHIFPALLTEDEKNLIENTVRVALGKMGNRYGAAHTEIRLSKNGCVIIEINARLAGGMIPELILQATGIDMLKNQLLLACGREPDLQFTFSMYSGIHFLTAMLTGKLKAIKVDTLNTQEGICEIKITAHPGKEVKPPECAYDRLGYIIIRKESYQDLRVILEKVSREVEIIIN